MQIQNVKKVFSRFFFYFFEKGVRLGKKFCGTLFIDDRAEKTGQNMKRGKDGALVKCLYQSTIGLIRKKICVKLIL